MFVLTICSIATYSFVAWLIPRTYPNQIDLSDVEMNAESTAEELKHIDYSESIFIAKSLEETAKDIYGESLELHIFDVNGIEVYGTGSDEKVITEYDTTKRTKEYNFSFAGDIEEYTFFFFDNSQGINQALEAIDKIFPYLIGMVFLISILVAFFYSRYITSPILKISKASEKMIELDFDLHYKTNRTDELGTVYHNLTSLAQKLSLTLQDLEKKNVQLQADMDYERQLEQQRTEFFSSVSHELKTPITIIKGQIQGMISSVGRYKDRDTYLIKSLKTLHGLETMVQELLMISRMEVPGYTCNRKILDLVPLIKQSLISQEDAFIEKEIHLQYTLPDNVTYNGDEKLLKRIFDNLITNAIKYSPCNSSVIISMIYEEESTRFSIENTGVHIAEDDLERIFEAFYRPDYSRNRQTGGSGLGLYIVKRILDMHGADYYMKNSENGVVFAISFIP